MMFTSAQHHRQEKKKTGSKRFPVKAGLSLMRFYGPLNPFFDKTWKPDDIVKAK